MDMAEREQYITWIRELPMQGCARWWRAWTKNS